MNQLRLCSRRRALATQPGLLEPDLDPLLGHRQGLACLIAGWEELPPAADDFLVGPSLSQRRVQPHQQMQVIVQNREPAHGNGENVRKFAEPMFDPGLTVLMFVAEQERASDATGNAVIPA